MYKDFKKSGVNEIDLPVDQVMEFISMYKKIQAGFKWLSAKKRSAYDVLEFRKLESKFDELWRSFPENVREAIWKRMVVEKVLPESIQQVVDIFNGKVVNLID